MQFSNDGLTIWFETEDAPGPTSARPLDQPPRLTVGVSPANPNHSVTIRYRVDGGLIRTLSAVLSRSNPAQNTQYFHACWPQGLKGKTVEYVAILRCAGRQVPDAATANSFSATFQLYESGVKPSIGPLDSKPQATASESDLPESSFPVNMVFLGRVKAQLSHSPEIIGETPEGLRVNWFLQGGEVYGPKLNAKIRPHGGDWMTIRSDGIGVLGIRATLETPEKALIYTTYSGVFDLGEEGYQNFLNKQWPNAPPLRSTPRFLTEHPKYKWLNRLQCIGIGEVKMSDLLVIYDLYAL